MECYRIFTVTGCGDVSIRPEEYTMVTTPDETAEKLTQFMIQHEAKQKHGGQTEVIRSRPYC